MKKTLLLSIVLTGCLSFPISQDEVSRVSSPTGDVDAVLVETNGGATTSFGYLVYLVRPGEKPSNGAEVASLYAAGRNERAYGANLKWGGKSRLVIEYLDAQIARLPRPMVVIGTDTVTVLLHSGVSDPSAPPGGMLYNLQRH